MSEQEPEERITEAETLTEAQVEAEELDGLPVLLEAHEVLAPAVPHGVQLARTAAVAATGFLAGAASAALLGHRVQRQLKQRAAPARSDIVASRTYLVSVHLLGRSED